MIAYLLHRMPDEERTALAERLMTEPDVYEAIRAGEADLLDGYARGTLNDDDRIGVETHLLGSAGQQEKLAFAKALVAAMPVARRRTVPWAWIGAAAAFVLLAAGAARVGLDNARMRQDLARLREAAPPVTGAVFSVLLPLDQTRAAAREHELKVPDRVEIVRLELEIDPGDRNELFSASASRGSEQVWSEAPIHAEPRGAGHVVPFWLPASVLRAGRYEITLASNGKAVGYYTLTITP